MLCRLIAKEIKIQTRGVIFYLFFLLLTVLYIITFHPMSIGKNICPLDEMHFMYRIMLNDYQNGTVINTILMKDAEKIRLTAIFNGDDKLIEEVNKLESQAKKSLSKEQKDYLGSFIRKIQRGTKLNNDNLNLQVINKMESELLQQIRFSVSYEEYRSFVNKFDQLLGGDTYYGDKYRSRLCTEENHSPNFGAIPVTEQEEYKSLYQRLINDINSRTIVVESTSGMLFTKNIQKEAVDQLLDLINYLESHRDGEEFHLDYTVYHNRVSALNKYLVYYFDKNTDGINISIKNSIYPDGSTQIIRNTTDKEAYGLYNDILSKDKYTNAFARLMADKLGLIILFLVVFLSGYAVLGDEHFNMREVIYTKQISAFNYIFAKYISVIFLTILSCLILIFEVSIHFYILGHKYNYIIDYFAFFKYFILWVLPTIIFGTAIGMLISLITSSGIVAIIINFFLFIISLEPLYGDYGLDKPVIRFNKLGSVEIYERCFNDIVWNRLFYIVLSAIFILAQWKLFEYKRCRISNGLEYNMITRIKIYLSNNKFYQFIERIKYIRTPFNFNKYRTKSFLKKISYVGTILKYNYRITCKANTILSIAFLASIAILFRNDIDVTYIAEHFISLIGIILFVSIECIEKRIGCDEIIKMKAMRLQYILRRFMTIIISFVLTFLSIKILCYGDAMGTNELILGTWITGVFLGGIGMVITNITSNILAGYIISFGYYVGALLTNDGLLRIFSLSTGGSFNDKYFLLAVFSLTIIMCGLLDIIKEN